MDAKNRLVLPLEIREILEIEKNGEILISASSTSNEKITVRISKNNKDSVNSVPFSKNGKYVIKLRRGTYER